jgi:hypothetical protein
MNRLTLVVVVLLMLLAGDAAAQWNVVRFETQPNRVYTTLGFDPAWVTSLGYGRVVPLWGRKVQLAGDVGVAAATMDVNDFRARVGAESYLVRWRSVYLAGSATFITRGTQNVIYTGLNFGADFTGTVGVYRTKWFAGGEFGFDKAIITHITNSDWYRNHFYADAKDGWYLNAGGTFHTGAAGGYTIGKAELIGRVGWLWTEDFNDLNPPMYASLGVGYGL